MSLGTAAVLCNVLGPPSSVLLHFEDPVLTELDSTVVECTAVGGEFFNLTLWWNEELVASVNGRHISYSTSSHPYGTYRCSVGDFHNTSVLLEKGECMKSSHFHRSTYTNHM